ncbi:MAG TPA: FGGY-family carbohydrate kinase [Anaerolineaceae bacterium]
MSLIGIDMGSSSVKVAAYREDGRLLALASRSISPRHPQPGWWETDPEDVWRATTQALSQLAAADALRADPPRALAISASGRENFPADAQGNPLGPNLMGADIRGEELETPPPGAPTPEPWTLSCGHLRERMDPVLRMLWWRKTHPEILERAGSYPDWHGFLTLRLCGRNVSERSLVGRWLVYDLASGGWSAERLAEYEIRPELLPEVLPWGAVIGEILPQVADPLGLPRGLRIVTGGHDLNCAGVGAGASRLGSACLISGSYENVLVPTDAYPSAAMLLRGLSITPHLGKIERSVYAICPTGNAVLNWARETVNLPLEALAAQLAEKGLAPSPVMALPYLSGAMLYWEKGRKLRGVLVGLTLATSPAEIVQAFMESIAYDHANTFAMLREENITIDQIRATGGGTRSEWWTQLKADVLQAPVEVCTQPEPGTFGAALLAGYGIGIYPDLDEAGQACSGTGRIYQPDAARAALHQDRLELYRRAVPMILSAVFEDWK